MGEDRAGDDGGVIMLQGVGRHTVLWRLLRRGVMEM